MLKTSSQDRKRLLLLIYTPACNKYQWVPIGASNKGIVPLYCFYGILVNALDYKPLSIWA